MPGSSRVTTLGWATLGVRSGSVGPALSTAGANPPMPLVSTSTLVIPNSATRSHSWNTCPPTMRRALATASIEAINGGFNAAELADHLQKRSQRICVLRSITTVIVIGALIGTLLYLSPAGSTSHRGGDDDREPSRTSEP